MNNQIKRLSQNVLGGGVRCYQIASETNTHHKDKLAHMGYEM